MAAFEDALEEAIKDRLAPLFAPMQIPVIRLPDTEAEHKRPVTRGRVTVSYHSSTYEANEGTRFANHLSTGSIVQDRPVDVELVFEAPSRRGEGGVLDMMRLARRYLVGFRPPHCGKLFALSDRYVGFDAGIWSHALSLRCHTRLVEAPEATLEPPVTKVTVKEDFDP